MASMTTHRFQQIALFVIPCVAFLSISKYYSLGWFQIHRDAWLDYE